MVLEWYLAFSRVYVKNQCIPSILRYSTRTRLCSDCVLNHGHLRINARFPDLGNS